MNAKHYMCKPLHQFKIIKNQKTKLMVTKDNIRFENGDELCIQEYDQVLGILTGAYIHYRILNIITIGSYLLDISNLYADVEIVSEGSRTNILVL